MKFQISAKALTGAFTACLLTHVAVAQTLPDAGRTLREVVPTLPPPPQPAQPIQLEPPSRPPARAEGGPVVVLRGISWRGNTALGEGDLLAAVGADALGQPQDLAGLRRLADRATALYRSRGFPFAQVFIPQQQIRDGVVEFQVIEGRYGRVEVIGDERLANGAKGYLRSVQPGDVIETAPLERSLLVLGDVPGIRVTPFVRPGAQVGEGDLVVQVEQVARAYGEVGADNAGSRYTGPYRLRGTVSVVDALAFADRLRFSAMISDEDLRLGAVEYELPVNYSGTRLGLSYARSTYELAREFAALDAVGEFEVAAVRLEHPLLRSQRANVLVSASLQHKELRDEYRAVGSADRKRSDSLPLMIRFDLRDGFGGGGISYGALTYTAGDLRLSGAQLALDAVTARKQGHFSKWNLDVARLQRVSDAWSLYGRLSAQHASKNLESSEKIGLAGANGVRAYPVGEGAGDRGYLVQAEVRYALGQWAPYAFYDAGRVTLNARPWDPQSSAARSISGVGIGVRLNSSDWALDVSLARRTHGGPSEADPSAGSSRVWAGVTRRF